MRAGRDRLLSLLREDTFKVRDLLGIEHVLDPVRSAIDQLRIEVGLRQQIDLPQSVLPRRLPGLVGTV